MIELKWIAETSIFFDNNIVVIKPVPNFPVVSGTSERLTSSFNLSFVDVYLFKYMRFSSVNGLPECLNSISSSEHTISILTGSSPTEASFAFYMSSHIHLLAELSNLPAN